MLLGAAVLLRADGERVVLERKAAALLALLAIDGPYARSDLCALLWPEALPSQARNSLRQRLFTSMTDVVNLRLWDHRIARFIAGIFGARQVLAVIRMPPVSSIFLPFSCTAMVITTSRATKPLLGRR